MAAKLTRVTALQSHATRWAGPQLEKFAPSAGHWLGWFGVVIGLGVIVIEPRTSDQVNPKVIFFGIAMASLCWVVLVRPKASARERGLLLQNMLRDVAIPWRRIERCAVGQTLVVTTDEAETFHGLGVTRSARAQMREQYGTSSILLGGRRATGRKVQSDSGPSMARGEYQGGTYTSYVESRISGLASSGERGLQGDPAAAPLVAWAPVPVALLAVTLVCVVLAFVL